MPRTLTLPAVRRTLLFAAPALVAWALLIAAVKMDGRIAVLYFGIGVILGMVCKKEEDGLDPGGYIIMGVVWGPYTTFLAAMCNIAPFKTRTFAEMMRF